MIPTQVKLRATKNHLVMILIVVVVSTISIDYCVILHDNITDAIVHLLCYHAESLLLP